ncbi:hypothetical protein FQA39_LY02046 [Lamprigera yunnana]|nr:hypothetical protein FQA39_LY02046 [Lamprigera yunnana]
MLDQVQIIPLEEDKVTNNIEMTEEGNAQKEIAVGAVTRQKTGKAAWYDGITSEMIKKSRFTPVGVQQDFGAEEIVTDRKAVLPLTPQKLKQYVPDLCTQNNF